MLCNIIALTQWAVMRSFSSPTASSSPYRPSSQTSSILKMQMPYWMTRDARHARYRRVHHCSQIVSHRAVATTMTMKHAEVKNDEYRSQIVSHRAVATTTTMKHAEVKNDEYQECVHGVQGGSIRHQSLPIILPPCILIPRYVFSDCIDHRDGNSLFFWHRPMMAM